MHRCRKRVGNRDGDACALLADLAVDEFAGDVKVSDVPRVLLQQVKQDALESRWVGALPALTWPTDVGQRVRSHDRGGDGPLRLKSTH